LRPLPDPCSGWVSAEVIARKAFEAATPVTLDVEKGTLVYDTQPKTRPKLPNQLVLQISFYYLSSVKGIDFIYLSSANFLRNSHIFVIFSY
tara:strand:+ start:35 stop:307 length:273 start_codon:yes stop_codon:yes gene_type:complete